QLEDAAAGGEDPARLVTDHETRARSRVVVVHQLEEKAETAAVAGDGLSGQALLAIVVNRTFSAVRTDEEGHGLRVASGRCVRSSSGGGAYRPAGAGRAAAT